MEYVQILTNQLITMFLYMTVGYLLFRKNLITEAGSKALSNLLLYVILPCVILRSFAVDGTQEKTQTLAVSLGLGFLTLLTAMLVSALVFRRNPEANFGSAFSNAGFMGIPLITAVLGQDAVFYIAGMVALLNIFQWTYGQGVLNNSLRKLRSGEIFKNPLVISFTAGLLIYALPISIPVQLGSAINAFASCNGPVAMVVLGVMLGKVPLTQIVRSKTSWLVCLIRLLLIPGLTLLMLSCFPSVSTDIRIALLIAAAAPVGSNLAVYVQKQGKDSSEAVKMICLSTLLSAVTMPVIMLLAAAMMD